jgi:hypothetical protein
MALMSAVMVVTAIGTTGEGEDDIGVNGGYHGNDISFLMLRVVVVSDMRVLINRL